MSQLRELARPFPNNYIHKNPSGGGSYVTHSVVVQRLLMVCGPFDFSIREVLRGDVAAIPANPQGKSERAKQGRPALVDAVVGCIGELSVVIDGQRVTVSDVGDCEDPHNWPHDGARLKDAASDAIKRCAARIGLGLHLWADDEFFLYNKLMDQDAGEPSLALEYSEDDPARPFGDSDE